MALSLLLGSLPGVLLGSRLAVGFPEGLLRFSLACVLIYAVRGVHNEAAVFDFRGAVPDTGATTVARLGERPLGARDALLEHLHDSAGQVTPSPRQPVLAAHS